MDVLKGYEPTNEFMDMLAEAASISREDLEETMKRNLSERFKEENDDE